MTLLNHKKQPTGVFCKKGVLKSFTNFTGKHLCWSLFLIKSQALRPATLLKSESNAGLSCEIFKNTYFEEHMRTASSTLCQEKSKESDEEPISRKTVDRQIDRIKSDR